MLMIILYLVVVTTASVPSELLVMVPVGPRALGSDIHWHTHP